MLLCLFSVAPLTLRNKLRSPTNTLTSVLVTKKTNKRFIIVICCFFIYLPIFPIPFTIAAPNAWPIILPTLSAGVLIFNLKCRFSKFKLKLLLLFLLLFLFLFLLLLLLLFFLLTICFFFPMYFNPFCKGGL